MHLFRYWAIASMAVILFTACHKDISTPAPAAPASTDENLVLTPAGYMERSRVHFIGEGQQLSVREGRLQSIDIHTGKTLRDFGAVKITPTRLPAASGWIAYSYWTNTGTPITYFTTNWVVPSAPTNKGSQTFFLFNGMQDGTTSTSYIIQPVLQWGPSAAGGGKYWAVTELRQSCVPRFSSFVTFATLG